MINVTDLVNKVRALAAENPDLVYPSVGPTGRCYYLTSGRPNDVPGCIMGQALIALDPELRPVLERADEDQDLIRGILDKTLGSKVVQDNSLDVDWLALVQAKQDKAMSWGKAVAYADDYQELG